VGVESIGKVFTLPFIPSPHREGKKEEGVRGDLGSPLDDKREL